MFSRKKSTDNPFTVLRHLQLYQFVEESNLIEGIKRPPTGLEVRVFEKFLSRKTITIKLLCDFVEVCSPGSKLRNQVGMNVVVGNRFRPVEGGPEVERRLRILLRDINAGRIDSYTAHIQYETLHPFMDGNGRSGRAIWAWQEKSFPRGFLHEFYYQSLANSSRVKSGGLRDGLL